MMKRITTTALILLLSSVLSSIGAEPIVLDDDKIAKSLSSKLGKIVDAGGIPTSKALSEQLVRKTCQLQLPIAAPQKKIDNVYGASLKSTVVISSIYKCDKCDDWHRGGGATAWVLSSDGVMVTNYHIFKDKDVAAFGIRTYDGKVAPVMEILAASDLHDIAIFRVKGEGFEPFALGPDAGVGEAIHIIAHPDHRFYTYTSGNVSRYYKRVRGKRRVGATCLLYTSPSPRD